MQSTTPHSPLTVIQVSAQDTPFKLTCIPTALPLLKKTTIPMPGDVIERGGQRWEVLKVVGYQPAKRTRL